MTNKPLYCYYCARTFLSAASLITYQVGDEPEERYHERGYEAIEGLAEMKGVADLAGKRFTVRINHMRSEMLLFGTVMVAGTSVCTLHVYDTETRGGRYYGS